MKNKYFDDETLTYNDLCFVCYMTERVARRRHLRNRDVAAHLGYQGLWHELSVASVSHALNPLEVEERWIADYAIGQGDVDVTAVDHDLAPRVPTPLEMGKVYARLITSIDADDNMPQSIQRVYRSALSDTLDNYNVGYYYEPSYVHTREFIDECVAV